MKIDAFAWRVGSSLLVWCPACSTKGHPLFNWHAWDPEYIPGAIISKVSHHGRHKDALRVLYMGPAMERVQCAYLVAARAGVRKAYLERNRVITKFLTGGLR
jgi:hypothetical protein